MTVEEGEIFYKSPSDAPVVCGIYMIAEPDKRIEVVINYLDVPCDNGGLVAVTTFSGFLSVGSTMEPKLGLKLILLV